MTNQHDNDEALRIARYQQATYGISERDYQAWRAQRWSAKQRRIPFLFSLLSWRSWWRAELAKIGPHAQRGRERDSYVMARKRDRGAYEVGNVVCVKPRDNMRDRDPDQVAQAVARATATRNANGKPRGLHLKIRGDGHPRSKAVLTPAGRFGSIALAAEAHGMTRAGGLARVRRGVWQLEAPAN